MEGEEGMGYESEWVRFLDRISKDELLADLAEYLNEIELTDRAKRKIKVYINTLFNREFAVSRISDYQDLLRLYDDKARMDADLPLGLTRFDITPEFQHVINLATIKFGIKIRRSVGGFERMRMSTSTQETKHEERAPMERREGVRQKISDAFR